MMKGERESQEIKIKRWNTKKLNIEFEDTISFNARYFLI